MLITFEPPGNEETLKWNQFFVQFGRTRQFLQKQNLLEVAFEEQKSSYKFFQEYFAFATIILCVRKRERIFGNTKIHQRFCKSVSSFA